jgi:starch-binding outer membrane protein, SusD/RagB family
MRTIYTYFSLAFVLVVMFTNAGCKKITEERSPDAYTEEDAVKSLTDLENLLTSCYDAFANQVNGKAQTANDLMADDLAKPLKDDAAFQTEIYLRNTTIFNSDVGDLYRNLYIIPFRVNSLDQFYTKLGIAEADRKQIDAEGKFLRAACHFEVLKLWAQPAGYTADNSHVGIVVRDVNSQLPKQRSSVAESYAFVIADLEVAIANLNEINPRSSAFATKNAAKALLAKVYFQLNQPAKALPLLNDVINNGGYSLGTQLNRFNNDSAKGEYIFATVSSNASTDNRGSFFIGKYRSDKDNESFGLSKEFYNLIVSDTSDKRSKLVGIKNAGQDNEYYVVKKFDKDYFGVPYLNLTDMLLMRAELLAEGGNLALAIADVNQIIDRAYSNPALHQVPPAATQADVLDVIRLQRRLEFFCEGDRVQSLKRRGAFLNAGLKIRNAPWNCAGLALQFPSTETGAGFVFNASGGCN